MCHVSVVMCHLSGFACHMSPATSHMQKVTATEPPPDSKGDRIRLDYEKIVFEEEKKTHFRIILVFFGFASNI